MGKGKITLSVSGRQRSYILSLNMVFRGFSFIRRPHKTLMITNACHISIGKVSICRDERCQYIEMKGVNIQRCGFLPPAYFTVYQFCSSNVNSSVYVVLSTT